MQPATLPQVQQLNIKKSYGIFSKLTMKISVEWQYFLMSRCWWDRSGGYSCTWICFNIYLSIIYFTWCRTRYTMRQTCVPPNVIGSIKLPGTQRSPELAFRKLEFCVPKNLHFPVPVKVLLTVRKKTCCIPV